VERFEQTPLLNSTLAIDQTGVGRAVVDMFVKAKPRARLRPITITGGSQVLVEGSGYKVPKKELVSICQVLLQSRRLGAAARIPHVHTLLKEMENFKVKINTNAVETFECLVAGTLIHTQFGLKPIEAIQVGDKVLTRAGYKPVLWSGRTRFVNELATVYLSNGQKITGTLDHPVWTERHGFVSLGQLRNHDVLLSREQVWQELLSKPNESSSTVRNTASRPATPTTTTSTPGIPCTERSGSTIADRSPPDFTSITRMAIRTITTLPTWNVLAAPLMLRSIIPRKRLPSRSVPSAVENSPVFPGGVPEVPCTARTTASVLGSVPSAFRVPSLASASSADSLFRDAMPESASVLSPVLKPTATGIDPVQPNAVYTASSPSAPCTRFPDSVHVSAPPVIVRRIGPVPVYDLTIEDCHEFLANGILVSNSWRERDHDDLVLALSLAAWTAERGRREFWVRV
jgi:hypothetical protein